MADERFCRQCGDVLSRKERETNRMFRDRKFCNIRCANTSRAARRVKKGTIRARTKSIELNLKPEVRVEVDSIAADLFRKRMMRGALI